MDNLERLLFNRILPIIFRTLEYVLLGTLGWAFIMLIKNSINEIL